ncbi:type 4a pilus biogenesis protein PilO [Bdellovibrio sp. SKB1291214]|uniref:type 4a pilus biogenesis protein PilO n=1 Tax=Bdellovibrio sp. SKB1291214 TaxID=1732569 RepID=UPI000B51CAFB|nr:type 4a pilus biogenesis protein PilO [Bdellovibrio sp. SKB1291214]UYL08964.1 type 4a pilus biogenesis protein PilO [Bdellovibrio sp. SKB1291214]
MNKLFDTLAGFTYGKTLGVGLVFAAVFYFTLYDDGSQVEAQIAAVQQQVQEQEAKKKDTDATLRQVNEMREKLGRLSQQYQEISRRLPTVLFSIDINKAIDSFARGAGVSVKIKKPAENIKREVVEEVPVDVTLEGSYAQLAQFVSLVSSSERMARVKNIVINAEDNSDPTKNLKFEGQVVGYKLAPEKPKVENPQ